LASYAIASDNWTQNQPLAALPRSNYNLSDIFFPDLKMIKVEFNPESFKVWSKCVNSLLKFGNEITIKLEDEEMTLSATSDCSSFFGLFTFHKPFFENYKVNDKLCLKLLTKPLANILKHNTEIEKCILKVQNDILSLEIECLHKVVKMHLFYYEEATLRKAIYSIKNENTWSIHPKAVMDILLSFPSTSDEISIATNTDSFEITNFKKICDNEKRDLNTMVSIELIDFTDYIIAKDSISSLDIKELKKILVFGECFDLIWTRFLMWLNMIRNQSSATQTN
jgi:hypothetical protein